MLAANLTACKKNSNSNSLPDSNALVLEPTFSNSESVYGGLNITQTDYDNIPKLTITLLDNLPDLDPTLNSYAKSTSSSLILDKFPPCLGKNEGVEYGQGSTPSCQSWAISTIESYYYFKEQGFPSYVNYFGEIRTSRVMSPTFIYYYYKKFAKPKYLDLFEIVSKKGICSWRDLPFDPKIDGGNPTLKNIETASLRASGLEVKLYALESTEIFKNALKKGYPIYLSVRIGENFSYDNSLNKWKIDSVYPYWDLTESESKMNRQQYIEKYDSYLHAMIIYGYDDAKGFLVRNSFGQKFGDNGDFWMPYKTLSHPGVFNGAFIYTKKSLYDIIRSTHTLFGDFNPSYNDILQCDINDFASDPTSSLRGNVVTFSRAKETRFELPFDTLVAREGTVEMEVYVRNAYGYNNYVLIDNDSTALLLSSDCGGADTRWPGGMNLYVRKDGTLTFGICTTKYGNYEQTITALNTSFRFNEWHKVSISYGSRGMAIKLDGQIVATNTSYTHPIAAGGNHTEQSDRFTVGEPFSYFSWGNNRYDRGFEGYISRFRTSSKQMDWALNR